MTKLTLDDVVAIDVHTHVEMSEAGGDSLPDELREAAICHFRGESARPTATEVAEYYRERKLMAVVFTVDAAAMHQAGHIFYRSTNGVWLVDRVPPQYLGRPSR